MNEITRQKIFEKLQQLDVYLSNLKKLKKEIKSPEEFLEDFHLYGEIGRALLTIELSSAPGYFKFSDY